MTYRSSADITAERVRALFAYDPLSGTFRWKRRSSPRVSKALIGKEAGTVLNGHRSVSIDGSDRIAAQLIWILVTGSPPNGRVRHLNGDMTDNRWENLKDSGVEGEFDYTTEGRTAYLRAHREAHRDIHREGHLRRKFGLTLADYAEIAVAQGGACAICERPETATRGGRVKALAVDHDHRDGKVRGLLCVECNTAIGKFGEDIGRLQSAIRYLRKHSGSDDSVVPFKLKES